MAWKTDADPLIASVVSRNSSSKVLWDDSVSYAEGLLLTNRVIIANTFTLQQACINVRLIEGFSHTVLCYQMTVCTYIRN